MSDILENLMTVLDEEHARAVVEHRRTTIKKPLTAFGAKLLAKRLAEWGDPNEAAEIMIERCWQGFKAEWIPERRRPAANGHRTIMDAARDRINAANRSTIEHDDIEHGQRISGRTH